jgi:hypothetical protein
MIKFEVRTSIYQIDKISSEVWVKLPKVLERRASLRHQRIKEELMKTSVLASLTLGLALAAPTAGLASSGASYPLSSHPMPHRKVVDHRHSVDSRAVAYAYPTSLPVFGMLADPSIVRDSRGHETDGLSRNPNDCVRWGCVDNSGS